MSDWNNCVRYCCPHLSPFSLRPHFSVSFPALLIIRPQTQIHRVHSSKQRHWYTHKGLMSWNGFCHNKSSLLNWHSRSRLVRHDATGSSLLLDFLFAAWTPPSAVGSPPFIITPHHARYMTEQWLFKQIYILFLIFCIPEASIRLWNVKGLEAAALYVALTVKALPRRLRWSYWNVLAPNLDSDNANVQLKRHKKMIRWVHAIQMLNATKRGGSLKDLSYNIVYNIEQRERYYIIKV